ncbi:SPOSA6832_04191, partial [Sporobolomyces salmonicolor]
MLRRIWWFMRTGPRPRSTVTSSLNQPTLPLPQNEPAKQQETLPHNPLVDLPLEEFLEKEYEMAWKRLLANVHPEGTAPGSVVAYEWTRDSAIVMRTIVQRYIRSPSPSDERLIRDYIEASRIMQHKQTVIGGFSDGGLGEVKYYVDAGDRAHEPFKGEWGRPQWDGPGSRVITMSQYALWALEQGSDEQREFVRTVLYPGGEGERTGVIKGDLDGVATHWQKQGFDLWEEVSGIHYYTLLTLRTSLLVGSRLAAALDDADSSTHYATVAASITPVLARFWSPSKQIVRVTLDHAPGRESTEENAHEGDVEYGKKSELDVAVVLAVLHAGRETGWANLADGEAEETASKVLATLRSLMDEMGKLYPLNKGRRGKKEAVALGRYPEDQYDGVGLSIGHPWYLATAGAAEFLYLLVSHLASPSSASNGALSSASNGALSSFPPLHGFSSSANEGVLLTPLLHSTLLSLLPPLNPSLPPVNWHLPPSSPVYLPLLRALIALGDSFARLIQTYVGVDGRLDEQIERDGLAHGSAKHEDGEIEDGKKEGDVVGRGARDLTWSYAAYVTLYEERKRARTRMEELEKGKGRESHI